MPNAEIAVLLNQIDQAFDHHSWHGTNLKGSIKGVTPKQAAWRPAPGRHNVWELVVHAAYWKYIVRRRMLGEAKGSFPLKGSNWFERPAAGQFTEKAWKADVALLLETHKSLREAIERATSKELRVRPRGSRVNNMDMIIGVAAHDLYHAGQIQLIKRLLR
jgi:uncharacterized damage-inducible protein DinB